MATTVELSIPNTSIISNTSKPYTAYNISIRLPLRSYTVQKRFSEFTTFNSTLTSQASAPPPAQLPGKHWLSFTSTVSNPALAEERRTGLETYLQAILSADNDRWRSTAAWKSFLNLPSNTTFRSSTADGLHSAITGAGSARGGAITDPVVWLDTHRELKSQLHDARQALMRRDQAASAQVQHEQGAAAKKGIVRAGTLIAGLDQGLRAVGHDAWGSEKLSEREVQRRKDLIANARREKEGLENLLNAMVQKSKVDDVVADAQENTPDLFSKASNSGSKPHSGGRVLGKETGRTKALDNQGVVQLQQQMMQEQDEDVMVLHQSVARQKQLAIEINAQLEEQKEMLGMLDEDVDRVQGKMDIAKKRIKQIS
ncbi:MAG: hypothetical protein HETSPECPRED_008918 [Heterodermia speciosa]|uniref:PX domain-containing protein n=1 Tax=Heterodermia speciosa TaxID=116794 RepID=A0A8H3EPL7_9LECA|nr:MAG: hypothetical protein HETSPECPRED_008918 [Heterodermia speciosa]